MKLRIYKMCTIHGTFPVGHNRRLNQHVCVAVCSAAAHIVVAETWTACSCERTKEAQPCF